MIHRLIHLSLVPISEWHFVQLSVWQVLQESPLPVNSNDVSLAWLQGIRIIMAIVAGYISIFIYWCHACPVTFLTCDIIIYRMFFMEMNMA